MPSEGKQFQVVCGLKGVFTSLEEYSKEASHIFLHCPQLSDVLSLSLYCGHPYSVEKFDETSETEDSNSTQMMMRVALDQGE